MKKIRSGLTDMIEDTALMQLRERQPAQQKAAA